MGGCFEQFDAFVYSTLTNFASPTAQKNVATRGMHSMKMRRNDLV